MTIRLTLACMLAAMGTVQAAQSIALSGKVTDPGGKPIGSAVVRLKSASLADTTDSAGTFSLNGTAVSVKNMPRAPGKGSPSLALGPAGVEWTGPEGERRDMLARLLSSPAQGEGAAGRAASGRKAPGEPLAKTQAMAADTLEVTALGYKSKAVAIASYSGNQDIVLESAFTGTCIASQRVNTTVRGSGPHSVVVETNSGVGIKEGTIYRPADLGPGKRYPILVWGEGACARNGLDNSASMAEIASHGYLVVADGTPNGSGSRPMNANNLDEMGRPALAYVTWAIAENSKPCSQYYQSLDTSKVAANGFSCGGLLAMGTAKDPRITTWGLTSSGSFTDNPTLWNAVHTPVLIIEGHKDETQAYANGLRDYNGIAPKGLPVLFLSHRNMGHGGDLWSANGGAFTRIHLAWLNWWLKGDLGSKGKGALVGSGCTYCTDSNWEVKSANIP